MNQKSIHGLDGMIWAIGVVEDRFDPLFLGRCKVRYHHHHTIDKTEIPTEDLPWSYPLIPLDAGTNVVGPKEGDWIIAFFRDGILAQQPIMMGVIPGIPEDPANPELGFYDPRTDLLFGHQVPRDPEPPEQHDDGSGTFWDERDPKSAYPEERYLTESTFFRTGRNENISETIVQQKRDNREIGQIDIPEAIHVAGTGSDVDSPGDVFSEPEIPYESEYPYNHLYYSESGHLIEYDDTPNAERYHRYHRLGSYEEIRKDGSRVVKTVNDDMEIVLKHKHIHIEASKKETIDWNYKIKVNKDDLPGFNYDIEIGAGGDMNIQTNDGKMNINLNGDYNLYVNGTATIEVEEDLIATVHRDAHIKVDENLRATVDMNADVWIGGDAQLEVMGDLHETVHGNVTGYVGKDKIQHIKGDYLVIVDGTHTTIAANIERAALGYIDDVALLGIRSASFVISDTAGTIFHNAPLTNCSGYLTGITTDSDSDVTPAGPAGPSPSIIPDDIPKFKYNAEKAVEAERQSVPGPLDVFQIFQDQIDIDLDYSLEDVYNALDSNSNSPGNSSNGSVSGGSATSGGGSGGGAGGGGGGGGGGSKGPTVTIDGTGGFLWKPAGANSGVATILYGGRGDVRIYAAKPDGSRGDLIEEANYIKPFRGDRGIHRGSKPGSSYGGPIIVSAGGRDYNINDPSVRHD